MLYIIVFVILIILIYNLITYNIFIKKQNSVKHAKSSIEVYLKQRFDLIPNLVKCVKEYTNYEAKIFEKITKLRTEYMNKNELTKGGMLDIEINKIVLLLENYPELKANEEFLNLQKNLTKMENQIQAARRIYNNEVEKYNTFTSIFPNNILANILKFKKEKFFEME